MSAIGTKRTSLVALHMSAFDPKRTSVVFPNVYNMLRNKRQDFGRK